MFDRNWYSVVMESMEGFIAEFERIGKKQFPRMKREHALCLVVSLYSAIAALVSGTCDLIDVSVTSHVFDEFNKPIVEGAILNGVCPDSESYDALLSRQCETYGEAAVLEATEIQAEKSLARNWNHELRRAFTQVAQYPESERTLEAVRDVFLERVESRNDLIAQSYPNQPLLKLDELNAALRAFG